MVDLLWDASEVGFVRKFVGGYILTVKLQVLESADVIQSYVEDRTKSGVENLGTEETPFRTIKVETIEENTRRSDQSTAPGARAKPLSTTNQRNLSAHKWLNCMDAFADEIQNVAVPSTQEADLKKEITVALIDDGVNIDIPTIAGKVMGGATFDRGEPDENGPSPYFHSDTGHGTVMADTICRVCPTAKLYFFKLETHPTQDPVVEGQTHKSLARAPPWYNHPRPCLP
jgi:hypothetical protein